MSTEIKFKEATREKSLRRTSFRTSVRSDNESYLGPTTPSPVALSPGGAVNLTRGQSFIKASTLADPEAQLKPVAFQAFAPNRRLDSGHTVEGGVRVVDLTENNLARHNFQSTNVHPFVHNFTSPIGASLSLHQAACAPLFWGWCFTCPRALVNMRLLLAVSLLDRFDARGYLSGHHELFPAIQLVKCSRQPGYLSICAIEGEHRAASEALYEGQNSVCTIFSYGSS